MCACMDTHSHTCTCVQLKYIHLYDTCAPAWSPTPTHAYAAKVCARCGHLISRNSHTCTCVQLKYVLGVDISDQETPTHARACISSMCSVGTSQIKKWERPAAGSQSYSSSKGTEVSVYVKLMVSVSVPVHLSGQCAALHWINCNKAW